MDGSASKKRKPKLSEEEKAEKSAKLAEERNKRRNEKRRKNPTPHTYGTGISDGPRKPYSRKLEYDGNNPALEENELSELPTTQQDVSSLSELLPTTQPVSPPLIQDLPTMDIENPYSDSYLAEVNNGKTKSAALKPKEDLASIYLAWQANEESFYTSLVNSNTVNQFVCADCESTNGNEIVKCTDCCLYLCHQCDTKHHSSLPFHLRSLFRTDFTSKTLLPTEFVDSQGVVKEQRINVPMLPPSKCPLCKTEGKIFVTASSTTCYLVTQKGRFDLHLPIFHCQQCNKRTDPDTDDYIASGLWPGLPNRFKILFHRDVLEFWYHLRLLTPGTSEQKYLECLSGISSNNGRRGTIDKKMFSEASKAHDYLNHLIDKRVRKIDKKKCRACVDWKTGEPQCLACHIDGNFKLLKYLIENESKRRSYFGNEIIRSDSELNEVMEEVNAVKPQVKKKGMCGNSEFKAAQEVSSQRKNLEVAGNMMGSCGHATLLTSVDMKESETYRHTLLLTKEVLKERNCKYLVNDVVCHFWVFLSSLAVLLPESFGDFTQKLVPFLSRLHGQAHAWYCQVIYFGHWKDGACGTLGEEQEQVFSVFSRYCNVTKYMSRSGRNDFLTLAMFYWNARKEKGLPLALTKRLLTAYYRAKFYCAILTDKLKSRGMSDDSQLKEIQTKLEAEARAHLERDKNTPSRVEIEKLKRCLVGTHLEWVSISDRIKTVAASCKWRNKLVAKRRKLEVKALELIEEINEKMAPGDERLTIRHFNDGVFPWDQASKVSFQEDFKLVDCWNLKKRNEECIVQTKKEMKNYLYSVANDLQERSNEIKHLLNASDLRSKGELAIKSNEHSRLVDLLRNALAYYRYFGEEDDEEYNFFSCLIKKSDDREIDFTLNEQAILNNSDDEEYFSSDEDE